MERNANERIGYKLSSLLRAAQGAVCGNPPAPFYFLRALSETAPLIIYANANG